LPGGSGVRGVVARIRSLWRGLLRRRDVEAEMAEEFRHHLELRTDDLIRQGLAPGEAARRARIEFGHVESHKERARAARGLRPFDQLGISWLDVKLGLRMLGKYPGLSLVSVVGMSVAIAIGTGGFGLLRALVYAELPLEEGERVVALQNADPRSPGNPNARAVHDFVRWRDELGSVTDVSAYMTEELPVTVPEGEATVAPVARMTASGFRLTRVDPLMGRVLLEEDEREGASPVVVISYGEWQRRFGADPNVLGRAVRLGRTAHTVVGVMPAGFGFPINHRYWVPLHLDPTAYDVGGGPAITMFGRLAPGVDLAQAQAELSTVGQRMARENPATHEHLRPRVLHYPRAYMGIDNPSRAWMARTAQLVLSLLLVVVAVNVAILVYARTSARMGEITVRSALGASRRRVVTQLFAEALVLSLIAAVIGQSLVFIGFSWFEQRVLQGDTMGLPFWVELGLSPVLVAYVAGLAVLAAVIVGVLPGLKATGKAVQSGLQQLHSGSSRLRLGRMWTALIVTQVAIAVAVLPYALYVAGPSISRGLARPTYPVEEFLRGSLSLEEGRAPAEAAEDDDAELIRFRQSATELVRRLEAEPTITGVVLASEFPGGEGVARVEIEGVGRTGVWLNRIDPDLFPLFEVPILAGRGFADGDATTGSNAVIVDRVFVEEVLGGGDVLGRRVRFAPDAPDVETPWLEIVGVVPEFTVPPVFQPEAPKLYVPRAPTEATGPVQLAVRVGAGAAPVSFVVRLREITESVDPRLHLNELETAATAEDERQQSLLFLALLVVAVTGSVLLLSSAGVYAMMSFTVASRRREIGIRSALGAAPERVLRGVFKRAGMQLAGGAVGGLLLAEAIGRLLGVSLFRGEYAHLPPTVALLVTAIGLLAAWGPARHGLSVPPTEALRGE
jgi:predicted permease